jgi:TruD family tRNA pseudouridine synthase
MNTTQFTPEQFVPAEVMEYIGKGRVPARIKVKPEDFIVEERQGTNKLCTVAPNSDFDDSYDVVTGKPGLVGVDLVKTRINTFDAINRLAQELRLPKNRISFAGLKDRWAVTAQYVVIDTGGTEVTIDTIRRSCMPEKIRGAGWFIKNARPAASRLSKGQLQSNRFTLNVQVPGLSAQQILDYIEPRLRQLEANGWVIPNAYGRQRLGRRQNLHLVGKTLIESGAEAAIKQFLCDTAPGVEREAATRLREFTREQWYYFDRVQERMEQPLDGGRPAYECLNMGVEYEIVCHLVEHGSFEAVMQAMKDDIFSLMIGAYQSFWFNQALVMSMRGEITLGSDGCIPLLVFDKRWDDKSRRETDVDGDALSFYKQYLPEAVPAKVDPTVRKLFLTPRRNHRGQASVPWRKAMIPVVEMQHTAEDGVWHCQFELRSGGYATTLLGLLFGLDQDEEAANIERKRPRHQSHGARQFGRR